MDYSIIDVYVHLFVTSTVAGSRLRGTSRFAPQPRPARLEPHQPAVCIADEQRTKEFQWAGDWPQGVYYPLVK